MTDTSKHLGSQSILRNPRLLSLRPLFSSICFSLLSELQAILHSAVRVVRVLWPTSVCHFPVYGLQWFPTWDRQNPRVYLTQPPGSCPIPFHTEPNSQACIAQTSRPFLLTACLLLSGTIHLLIASCLSLTSRSSAPHGHGDYFVHA